MNTLGKFSTGIKILFCIIINTFTHHLSLKLCIPEIDLYNQTTLGDNIERINTKVESTEKTDILIQNIEEELQQRMDDLYNFTELESGLPHHFKPITGQR